MITEQQKAELQLLIDTLSSTQIAWVSGYLARYAEGAQLATIDASTANSTTVNSSKNKLLVYYATETNNSKQVAQDFSARAKKAGFQVRIASIREAHLNKFAQLKDTPVIFVCSTHGEGDPPEMAHSFFEALRQFDKDLDLSSLRHCVLGLGDKSYTQYCQAAVELNSALTKRRATELYPIQLLDVDFAEFVPTWIDNVLSALGTPQTTSALPSKARVVTKLARGTNRLNAIEATLTSKVNLNDRGSLKETWHIEIALSEEIDFQPGDALGIVMPVRENEAALPARLYSIANTPLIDPLQVHLTVALAWYDLDDGTRGYGKCSQYLTNCPVGETLRVYVHKNPRFRLPAPDKDIIMIGPGTGIAPFRAFIQQRQEQAATGRNWLFFGEQHAHCDFLYQAEWQEHLAGGSLNALSLAFSRDQQEKRYVQHLLLESADELRQWLDAGASIYVCGRKSPMSEDVEQALKSIIAKDSVEATALLEQWSEEERYMKDVY